MPDEPVSGERPATEGFFSRHGTSLLLLLFLAAFSFTAYWQTLNDGPVADDWGQMVRVARVPFSEIWRLFAVHSPYFIRPVPFFLMWVLYRFFELDLTATHVIDVFMHAVNAFMVFWFLKRMGAARITAVMASVLFVSIPLAAEAVAWTRGIFDIWSLFFLIITLGLYGIYLQEGKRGAYIGAMAAAVTALLSKEPAMMLVFLIPTMEILYGGILTREVAPGGPAWRDRFVHSSLRIAIFLAIFAGFIAMRYAIMGRMGQADWVPLYGIPSLHAVRLTVIGLLAPLDQLEVSKTVIYALAAYTGLLYLVSLLLVVFRWKQASDKARRLWIFFVVYFCSSLVFIFWSAFMVGLGNTLANSRFYYIPTVGMIALLVLGLYEFGPRARSWRVPMTIMLLLLLPVYFWGIYQNSQVWGYASGIEGYIATETQRLLPDPPSGASLYYENLPVLDGGHIYGGGIKHAINLQYGRPLPVGELGNTDIKVFFVNPDPALRERITDAGPVPDDGYLFVFDWQTEQLRLVKIPSGS